MIVQYNKSDDITKKEKDFPTLFNYYYAEVVKKIKEKTHIIIQGYSENNRLEHAYWKKRKNKEKIIRWSLMSALFAALAAILILALCMDVERCLQDETVKCTWDSLKTSTKNRLKRNIVNFQDGSYELWDVVGKNESILRTLSDSEIRDPKSIRINVQNLRLNFEYYERSLRNIFSEYISNFGNKSCPKIISQHETIAIAKIHDYIYNSRKIYHISDDSLTGKTTLLKKIAKDRIDENKSQWVAYLDLTVINKHPFNETNSFENANWTAPFLTDFLIKAHSNLTKFEAEVFRNHFKNGTIVLFIDNIDALFMSNEKMTKMFANALAEKTHHNAEVWIASREWTGNEIKNVSNNKTSFFKLLPLFCNERYKYIHNKILKIQNLTQSQKEQVHKLIDAEFSLTENWRDGRNIKFDNICLLEIILKHTVESVANNRTSFNLNSILEDYTSRIMNFKFNDDDLESKKEGYNKYFKLIAINLLHKKYDLNGINKTSMIRRASTYSNGTAMNILNMNDRKWNIQHSAIKFGRTSGFLKIYSNNEVMFLHETFYEYYVAKYIMDSFRKNSKEMNNKALKEDLLMLMEIFVDDGNKFSIVRKIINEIFQEIQKTDEKVKYKKKFKNFFKIFYIGILSSKDMDSQIVDRFTELFADSEYMKIMIFNIGINLRKLRKNFAYTECGWNHSLTLEENGNSIAKCVAKFQEDETKTNEKIYKKVNNSPKIYINNDNLFDENLSLLEKLAKHVTWNNETQLVVYLNMDKILSNDKICDKISENLSSNLKDVFAIAFELKKSTTEYFNTKLQNGDVVFLLDNINEKSKKNLIFKFIKALTVTHKNTEIWIKSQYGNEIEEMLMYKE